MNFKNICRISGKVVIIEGIVMLLPLCVSIIYGGEDAPAFLISIAITIAAGFLLSLVKSSSTNFFAREGFMMVAAVWILVSVFGSLPYLFSGYFVSYIDCFFECVSGFTTTGASVFSDVESLPRGILFWRCLTIWMGGMGVLILFLALLPKMGLRSQHIMRAEAPGPLTDKLVPQIGNSSKILYAIYLILTIVQIIVLLCAGMPFYDSVAAALSTGGTGGFSIKNLSIGGYANPLWQNIIGVFMLIFGINFAVYYFIITKKIKQAAKSIELRFFLCVVAVSVIAVSLNISHLYPTVGETVRHAFFQVASIITTTGFTTADFNTWPEFPKILLVILMVMGACSGSTSGGIKGIRVIMLFKALKRELWQITHPRGVKIVMIDGKSVPEATLASVSLFFSAYIFIFLIASLIVSLDKFNLTSSMSAVVATLSNIGPGFDIIGPYGNYSSFSPLSKIVLSLCMLAGRLEILPLLVLFAPSSWRK